MVLNPAWFNALVDDTGTGTTGTVWNKAAIKGLTDSIDGELNRVNIAQGPYTPTISGANGGTPAYSLQAGFWASAGKIVWMGFNLSFTKGSLVAGGALRINLPFNCFNLGTIFGGVSIGWFIGLNGPVAGLSTYLENGTATAVLAFVSAGGAAASNYLLVDHLGAGTISFAGHGIYLAS